MDYRIFNVRTDVNACHRTRGCTDTVRESALQVDSWRKIPCRTGESNLRQQLAGLTLYQLSYISTPFRPDTDMSFAVDRMLNIQHYPKKWLTVASTCMPLVLTDVALNMLSRLQFG